MRLRVADQQEARVVGNMRPLVQIEGDRLGALDAGHQRAQALGERGQRAERPVDVEPELVRLGDVGDGVEIVHGAGVDRARGADDQERQVPLAAVLGDRGFEPIEAHGARARRPAPAADWREPMPESSSAWAMQPWAWAEV